MAQRVQFRCNYCQSMIPWAIAKEELGIRPEEEFQLGQVYPYEKCSCGWGKFVLCQELGAAASTHASRAADDGGIRKQIEEGRYARIPLDQIDPNPYQPRRFFESDALRSLAESIRTVGLLEDIVVRPVSERYQIVLGERRWRASRLAGCSTISAKVVALEDEAARLIAITENVHREDLTQVEEAFAYKQYVDEGKQLSDVGEYFGKIGDRVAERLKVLNTHNYIQYQEERIRKLREMVERLRGQVTANHNPTYESKVVALGQITEWLNLGYDLVAVLDREHIIIRRKIA